MHTTTHRKNRRQFQKRLLHHSQLSIWSVFTFNCYFRWKTLLNSRSRSEKRGVSVKKAEKGNSYFIQTDEELICILLNLQIGKSSPRTTSLCSASLADWLEDCDPTCGKELMSFMGRRSNSAHFFSISSSMRSRRFDPTPLLFLNSTASHWLLVFLSSCHWLCSLPCPSPASLWLAGRGVDTGESST